MGRKGSWNGQTRERDGMAILPAIWLVKWHIVLGAGLTLLAIRSGTSLGWIAPVAAGLVLAPFFAASTARKDLGSHVAKRGLFQVAEPWWRTERSEEHTSELPSLMRISSAVYCLNKKQLLNMSLHRDPQCTT